MCKSFNSISVNSIVDTYRKYIPEKTRRIVYGLIINPYFLLKTDSKKFFNDWKWRFKLLFWFNWGKGRKYPIEYKNAAKFLFLYGKSLIIGDFIFNYLVMDIKVFQCERTGLYYVLLDNKKLFFKRGLQEKEVKSCFKSLLLEQDPQSPHSYVGSNFCVNEDSVLYDVGAAEGIFTLLNIEKVKYAFLFECDEEWIEALNMTFQPWKDKITIVQRYVSDRNEDNCISLDEFAHKNIFPDYVKMDIEGAECKALSGAADIIKSKLTKWSVCVYHRHEDKNEVLSLFDTNDYNISFSEGLMFVLWEDNRFPIYPPYFRNGILKAKCDRKM